jgi:hypothetical protein
MRFREFPAFVIVPESRTRITDIIYECAQISMDGDFRCRRCHVIVPWTWTFLPGLESFEIFLKLGAPLTSLVLSPAYHGSWPIAPAESIGLGKDPGSDSRTCFVTYKSEAFFQKL